MADRQEQKFRQLTEQPVNGLICRLAVPCIINMLVTGFYNMADTFFVGMMNNTSATGAVGVVFTMMSILQSVGIFCGQGGGVFIARALGAQNHKEASDMAATSFYTAIAMGAVICVFGQIFLEPLAYLLGSTETILPYTKQYLRIILVGAPWVIATFVLMNQLRYQGSAVYSTLGTLCGAILNIGLDPILIYTLDMGVAGAALGTVIGQAVSFLVLLGGCARGSTLSLHPSHIQLNAYYYKWLIKGGLPSFARHALTSVATILLNHAVHPYGDAAIAAMGIVQRIMNLGASAMIGFGQGFQPVCGYNYGAKLYKRVKQAFFFCVKGSFAFLLTVSVLGFIFAPELVAIFRDDPEVVAIGIVALRFRCVTFPLYSWIVISNMLQQSTGRHVAATFFSVAKEGLFFIPMLWILVPAWGLLGVQMTQSAADVLTMCCAVPIQLRILRGLDKMAKGAGKENLQYERQGK